MLRKQPPVDPVLSCLSCFRKPSIGVCQVISNSPDPGIAWPSVRFPPDLWRWFAEDTASIRRLIHSGYMAKQREATGLDNRGKWKLLSGMKDIFIPHEIRPFEAKNSSQAPLVQRFNSMYICFVDCPAFRCVQHDGEDIHRVSKKLCQCYFVNNSVKYWPNLIIFGRQHREETWHKWP